MTEIDQPQDALVAVMLAVSAADERLTDSELASIVAFIGLLPAFRGYDQGRIERVSEAITELFEQEDGLDTLIGMIKRTLPPRLRETAYALACDVAAADGKAEDTELRLLQMLRQDLEVDRLTAAAIERGARARHQRI